MTDAVDGCIFCRIVAGEIPATVVHETPDTIAFRDINPRAPVHVLVIPRRHIASLDALGADDHALAGRLLLVAGDVARQEGIADRGYRVIANVGAWGGQTVDHLHLHVMGGRAFHWPPG
jgi:histidine triad (HIT) family protein